MVVKIVGVENGFIIESELEESHRAVVVEEGDEDGADLECSRRVLYEVAELLGLPMGSKHASKVRIIIENNGMEIGH